ncbi:hypothetical protein WA1_10820 [Scytonema hofmannii PCC 7110]|uniref:DUF4365 domain-containing protein n=1 Tax=Scytonema hofmannii PCC 7110 TaxID=128403 RepID=A0A139XFR8_9CYAN|nr:DUF4365 domain-containing protein [Scytonema hofmannii]KYC43545.1 hypothetical protein WA1_10820 [Scytonema hofmannii PCC 7110]
MYITTQKEEFSYAYINAVASAAGYSFQIAPRPLDLVGVDITITGLVSPDSRRRTRLDLQVKCTSRDLLGSDSIRYPLDIKNYDELRNDNPDDDPLILVVVLVPDNVDDWLHQSEDKLCLKHCAYWMSLYGQPQSENQTTVTVYLPRQNVFSVDTLKNLMQRTASGERI